MKKHSFGQAIQCSRCGTPVTSLYASSAEKARTEGICEACYVVTHKSKTPEVVLPSPNWTPLPSSPDSVYTEPIMKKKKPRRKREQASPVQG